MKTAKNKWKRREKQQSTTVFELFLLMSLNIAIVYGLIVILIIIFVKNCLKYSNLVILISVKEF